MTRVMMAAALTVALTAPAWADVTIKQTTTGKGLGMSGTTPGTTYIKGSRMRTDTVQGKNTMTTIFDLDAQKMYSFDSRKKEVDVWDMQAVAADLNQAVDMSSMTASVTPNGQTKQVAGKSATGYDMEVSVASQMGGNSGPKMMVKLTGPMWVVKDDAAAREYIAFYQAAVEKGWIFSDPRAAKASPGQARAMAQMYKQLADTGGVPYQTEMQIRMEGSGPMAGLMARMGNITMTTVVDSVETGTLSDDLFAPPAGYKLNARK